jgi:hypothetical protein
VTLPLAPEPITVDDRGLLMLFSLTPSQAKRRGIAPRGRSPRLWIVAEVKAAIGVAEDRQRTAANIVDSMLGKVG